MRLLRRIRFLLATLATFASSACDSEVQVLETETPKTDDLPRDCGWVTTRIDPAGGGDSSREWRDRVAEIGRARVGRFPGSGQIPAGWSNEAGLEFRVEIKPTGAIELFEAANPRVRNPRKTCRNYVVVAAQPVVSIGENSLVMPEVRLIAKEQTRGAAVALVLDATQTELLLRVPDASLAITPSISTATDRFILQNVAISLSAKSGMYLREPLGFEIK